MFYDSVPSAIPAMSWVARWIRVVASWVAIFLPARARDDEPFPTDADRVPVGATTV